MNIVKSYYFLANLHFDAASQNITIFWEAGSGNQKRKKERKNERNKEKKERKKKWVI